MKIYLQAAAIVRLLQYLQEAIKEAKQDDGKISPEEAADILVGFIAALLDWLVPQMSTELKAKLEAFVDGVGGTRDRVTGYRKKAANVLGVAERFFEAFDEAI